jgi:hypothetical protein
LQDNTNTIKRIKTQALIYIKKKAGLETMQRRLRIYSHPVLFLSLNALEQRSSTFFRRIFKVLRRFVGRELDKTLEFTMNICLKYNKLNLC